MKNLLKENKSQQKIISLFQSKLKTAEHESRELEILLDKYEISEQKRIKIENELEDAQKFTMDLLKKVSNYETKIEE